MNEPPYHVFISYSSRNVAEAKELNDQLEKRGIRPWFDRRRIDSMDIITDQLAEGLLHSDLVVAIVSDAFLGSNPCRWEALRTFVRSAQEGIDRYSLVALEPRPQLWPALKPIHAPTWTDAEKTSEMVVAALENVQHRTPRPAPTTAPSLFQVRTGRLRNFVGRFESLLLLYAEALTEHANLDAGALVSRRKIALVGMGGMGKTAIAMKFAEDFAEAFPGGIVWLTAGGDDVRSKVSGLVDRDLVLRKVAAQVERWTQETATRLALPLQPAGDPGTAEDELHATMSRAKAIAENIQGTVLWILDDVPAGMSPYLDDMACPAHVSVTLITARNDLLEGGFPTVNIDQLETDDAVTLLKRGRRPDYPWSEPEEDLLRGLAIQVGGHALTIDVMRARIGRGTSPGELDRQLTELSDDLLDDDLSPVLPTGHEASIVRTLQASMTDVVQHVPEARTVLLLLAVTPDEPRVWLDLVDETLRATGSRYRTSRVVEQLVGYGLLINDDEAGAESFIQVHAIIRMVARLLLARGMPPLDVDPQTRRTVAVAAARWFARRGNNLRNDDDLGAVDWFQHALFPLEDYTNDPSIAERVLRAECMRGIARAEFRAPTGSTQGLRQVADPNWEHALDLAIAARAHVEEGLEAHPDDSELVLARAQALALHGIILNQKADRLRIMLNKKADHLRLVGDLDEARAVNDQAIKMVREQIGIRQQRANGFEPPRLQAGDPSAATQRTQSAREDAARAWINLPGLLIDRAKILRDRGRVERREEATEAVAALDEADEIYRRILARREEIFPPSTRTTGQSLEIAACAYGIGAVAYVRGTVVHGSGAQGSGVEQVANLARIAAPLAQSTRLRLAGNVGDASKCLVLTAKVGLALRASVPGSDPVPWDKWLGFADRVTPPAGEVHPGLPDPDGFPAALDELIAEATHPTDSSRQACARSRDAAALAALAALDQLAGLPDDSGARDELAAVATELARASLAWLALTEKLGARRSQTTDYVMTDWAEEETYWLADAPESHRA